MFPLLVPARGLQDASELRGNAPSRFVAFRFVPPSCDAVFLLLLLLFYLLELVLLYVFASASER